MKKKSKGLWIVAAVAGVAIAAYEVFVAPSHVPAGYTSIPVSAGAKLTPTTPANGQLAFVLPSGGKWTGAARGDPGSTAQVTVPLPSSASSPLLVTGVTAATGFMLQWTDSTGATQTGVVVFA